MKELSQRLQELFEQSVEDYIKSAVPISSGAICAKGKTNLSPATVRNDLKTLEQMGYLKQVHTSGGRVPTTQGYRIYVNTVMQRLNIKPGELTFAADNISERIAELPDIIDNICKNLEQAFNYPIIVKQQFDNLVVQEIKIVPLIYNHKQQNKGGIPTMVLIKTKAGHLSQNIATEYAFTDKQCDDASAAMNTKCIGMTLKEMTLSLPTIAKDLSKSLVVFDSLCRKLSEKLEESMQKTFSRRFNMIKLLDIPDYNNIETLKKVGTVIEDDEIMDQVMASEDSVVIGTEIANSELEGSSVIKFDYRIGDERIASVGILGPERMDYKGLIGALHALMATTVEQRRITGGDSAITKLVNE